LPIGTGSAIGLGIAGAAGSIGGAALQAHATGKAASAQVSAANYAATLQKQAADEALAFQKQMWGTEQANIAPWLKAGQGAIGQLSDLAGNFQPWNEQFQAPTGVTEQNDPGYQFRLQQGQQALENSAAARGGLLSGGTARAIEQYGQDYASNEYGNVYGRQLGEYQQRYNIFQQNQANQFNRLAAVAGAGQTAAGQLGQLGQAASGNVANILLGSAGQIGQSLQNAGAARASGYVGGANAWAGGISGGINSFLDAILLKSLLGRQSAPAGGAG